MSAGFTYLFMAVVWIGHPGSISATQNTIEFFKSENACHEAAARWQKDYKGDNRGWATNCQRMNYDK